MQEFVDSDLRSLIPQYEINTISFKDCAQFKAYEKSGILQVLDESTDSEISLVSGFSSEDK